MLQFGTMLYCKWNIYGEMAVKIWLTYLQPIAYYLPFVASIFWVAWVAGFDSIWDRWSVIPQILSCGRSASCNSRQTPGIQPG